MRVGCLVPLLAIFFLLSIGAQEAKAQAYIIDQKYNFDAPYSGAEVWRGRLSPGTSNEKKVFATTGSPNLYPEGATIAHNLTYMAQCTCTFFGIPIVSPDTVAVHVPDPQNNPTGSPFALLGRCVAFPICDQGSVPEEIWLLMLNSQGQVNLKLGLNQLCSGNC
ncbi:hypothetical protein OAO01_00480 [Oligoflexia bacterium]|nr:hypothetical protein [Oligoflexia bacterium]